MGTPSCKTQRPRCGSEPMMREAVDQIVPPTWLSRRYTTRSPTFKVLSCTAAFCSKALWMREDCLGAQMLFGLTFWLHDSNENGLMDPVNLQVHQGYQLHPGQTHCLVSLGSCQVLTVRGYTHGSLSSGS